MTDLPTIDHIGVIVDDLEEAQATFQKILGVEPSLIKDLPEAGLRIARFEAANVAVELVEYSDDGNGFGRQVMGSETGLNHLSFRVDTLSDSLSQMASLGLKPQKGFPRQGSTGPVVFFEKEPNTGLLLEINQHRDEDSR